MGDNSPSVGKTQHTPWVQTHAKRLRELFEQQGSELAEGWALTEVREDVNRVVLVMSHPEEADPVEFMVIQRAPDVPCIAFSDDYNFGLIWEKETPCLLDRGQTRAMEALQGRLEVKPES